MMLSEIKSFNLNIFFNVLWIEIIKDVMLFLSYIRYKEKLFYLGNGYKVFN